MQNKEKVSQPEQQHQQANLADLVAPKLHHSMSLPVGGGELEGSQRSKLQELFNIPDLRFNKHYQRTIKQIVEILNEFDRFTDNLEHKVDKLLAAQQTQFVDSYKQHMQRVQREFQLLEQEVGRQKQLIQYYENEGKMSNLVKKVAMLENQSKRLYEIISKKEKEIKSMALENRVQKEENKRLYAQVKQFMKNKNKNLDIEDIKDRQDKGNKTVAHISIEHSYNLAEEPKFFTTEIQQQRSIKKDLSITTDENKDRIHSFTYNRSQKSIISPEEEHREERLRKQLALLLTKNRKLLKLNSRMMEERNELQTIFMNAITEIKRQITLKRKIKQCTYEDFAKEDKINLLLTIVSNQEILRFVYQKIFNVRDELDKGGSLELSSKVGETGIGKNPLTSKSLRRTNNKMGQGSSQLPYL